ncbi:hypothetical protein FOVSG1_009459 [Fusarium oxysporum f. sp. vasinfectum]
MRLKSEFKDHQCIPDSEKCCYIFRSWFHVIASGCSFSALASALDRQHSLPSTPTLPIRASSTFVTRLYNP